MIVNDDQYEKELETGELCSVCGKRYLTVFSIPDDVWLKVNGGKEGGLICISCVDEIARKLGISLFWKAKENEYPC